MSTERKLGPSPFRVELKPFTEGADPYKESNFKGTLGEINHRAVLMEIIHLYDESEEYPKLRRTTSTETRGFMDIKTGIFPDNTRVYHPFFYWGLKDINTQRSHERYGDSSTYVDPIHTFRAVKVLEALPTLSESKDQATKDYVDVMMATEQGEFEDFAFWYGRDEAAFVNARKRISSLIGQDLLSQILETMPPDLQAMIQVMGERQIGIDTRTLKREIDLGKILPSELYKKTIEGHDKELEEMTRDIEDIEKNGTVF